MLICHKLVASNAVEVLQACHMLDVHATLAVSIMPASWEVVCRWASHPVLSIISGFSNTHHHSAATPHYYNRCMRQLSYPWKLHASRANNNYFQYILLNFMLYVFGIVSNCITQNNSYCLHWQYFSI